MSSEIKPYSATLPRRPFWPVVVSPFVAGIYYLAVKLAFAESISAVMGRADFFEVPRWGSHWIFRIVAETIAIGFGTFVAIGLARGRERITAVVAGLGISAGFLIKLGALFSGYYSDPASEPWYQHAIDVLAIIAAPLIGGYVSEAAEDLHRDESSGVGGINGFHFIWLWLPAYYYALGLITPVSRLYLVDQNLIAMVFALIINAIPAAAIAVPGYYGLTFLSGLHGNTMHPAGRNLVGSLVLIFGFVVGIAIQSIWYLLFQKIYLAIFG
jgi:hypothetical protein